MLSPADFWAEIAKSPETMRIPEPAGQPIVTPIVNKLAKAGFPFGFALCGK
jgi:hypothetical protein